jgi:hypothetical protein
VLFGTGGVPAQFVPYPPPGDKAKGRPLRGDGDNVNWVSKNPIEPDKHSK